MFLISVTKVRKKIELCKHFSKKTFRILHYLTIESLKRYFSFVTNPVFRSTKKTSYSSRARRHHNYMKKTIYLEVVNIRFKLFELRTLYHVHASSSSSMSKLNTQYPYSSER